MSSYVTKIYNSVKLPRLEFISDADFVEFCRVFERGSPWKFIPDIPRLIIFQKLFKRRTEVKFCSGSLSRSFGNGLFLQWNNINDDNDFQIIKEMREKVHASIAPSIA